MVPHIVRAQSIYKNIVYIHFITCTHTHTLQIHGLLVMDWYQQQNNDISVWFSSLFSLQDDQDWGGVLRQQIGGTAGFSETAESQLLQEPPQVGGPRYCLFLCFSVTVCT